MERLLDCWFLKTTGIPCPGCGMTRAYLAFFQGDMKEAFHFHPLFWLVPIVFFLAWMTYRSNQNHSYKYAWRTLLIILLTVYIVRMVCFFPNQEPMVFDESAFFPKLFSFFLEKGRDLIAKS